MRLQEPRRVAGRQRLHHRDEVVRARKVAQRKRRVDRDDERLLDAFVHADGLPRLEHHVRTAQSLGVVSLREQQRGLRAVRLALLLQIRRALQLGQQAEASSHIGQFASMDPHRGGRDQQRPGGEPRLPPATLRQGFPSRHHRVPVAQQEERVRVA